mmetsp:Transcript_158036/g.303277  ORF Transcript_158036/g.303277 Transcript_158036/m.303277 type:complete len:106 (-) Transcript_158036:179-496(-)
MDGWREKIRLASFSVEKAVTTQREAAGSPDAGDDLEKLTKLLAETEAAMQDDDFCAEHIGPIEWLLEDIEILYKSDASADLLDPTQGHAVRTKMIGILDKWKDAE